MAAPNTRIVRRVTTLCLTFVVCLQQVVVAQQSTQESGSLIHDDNPLLTASEILLRVYDETRGLRWQNHDNWLQNTDVCSWHGVICYDETASDQRRAGHIRQLDLSGNRLLGVLPSTVFQLPYLESLDVRDNADLTVTFDGIEEAQYLKELSISNTHVPSMEGIEMAPQLETLHITGNGMTGPIPTQIFQLTSLLGLYANYNKFTGSLSSQVEQLKYLKELYLFDSDLTGQIPSEIGRLSNLEILTLAENGFGGTLPEELNKCTNLRTLAIDRADGMLKGPGISGELPSFSQLSNLADLRLQNQLLSGSIPADFLSMAPKQEVVKVNLSGNALTGPVPTMLKYLQRLSLLLTDNQISSVSEDLCNSNEIDGWMEGNVGTLGCDAFLCPPGTTSSTGRATPEEPCGPCDDVKVWGSTKCASSPTTTSAGYSEREVLIKLYNYMGGRYWKHDDDWLSPSEDACDWWGVECVDGKVTGLHLKNNELSNAPPIELFSLPELKHLDLSMNSIDFKFEGIGKATKLESLILSGCDLTSLENIGELSLTPVRRLLLASNSLTGSLPTDLFSIVSLEELDFSHNRFTGELPATIGGLTNLENLMFTKNRLTGQLPSNLGSLITLRHLIGSDNDFSGVLPSALNSLTRLESLSIHQTSSSKGIGGSLLAFSDLTQLTSLQLDANELTGTLPEDFLRSTEKGDGAIDVMLSDNKLDGNIPESWASRFASLELDLTGNRISGIHNSICAKTEWNNGNVNLYSCDAVLCPPGKFNEIGRQTGSGSVCRDCANQGSVQYYGSKTCSDSANAAIQESSQLGMLQKFFHSTNGNDWTNNAGWTSSTDPCNGWYGVQCDTNGKVSSIELENNGLNGSPSSAIFQLTSLRFLNLKDNQISFSFGGIGQATSLNTLILSGTGLTSVEGISKATSLTELHLTDNELQGEIPEEILSLTGLRQLYLNYNSLSGRIPPTISALRNLEELFLLNNRFVSQLPASIGLLTELKHLSLAENSFTGTLPPELNDLTNLEVLSIQREGGTDSVSVGIDQGANDDLGAGIGGPLIAFDNLKFLRKLYLGVNSLTGSIPHNFLDGIENKALSLEVDLISNRITGEIPASLTQFADLSLYAAGNQIENIADGLCQKGTWMQGAVGQYRCDAILCPPGTASEFGRQRDQNSSCVTCPSNTWAEYYGSFECLGAEDKMSLSERTILEDFYRATGGGAWKRNTAWMDSDESLCSWYGITCAADKESVASIRLPGNGLRGTVPEEIYNLPNLKVLDVAMNLVDVSFGSVGIATELEYLQLEATAIVSLSGLEAATGLKVLYMANNDLNSMQFPNEILSLTNLESLDLSRNVIQALPSLASQSNLKLLACSECGIAGSVPAWLTSLTKLEHVELEGNLMTGALPSLAALTSLKYFNMAHQLVDGGRSPGLTGSVPSFSGMKQLQQVYLQNNDLSGSIPQSFLGDVGAHGTVTVDLRFNNITGAIPSDLSRIPDLRLDLASNKIDTIADSVCTASWNGGQSGESGCDHILCRKGSFNALGRATSDLPCTPCDESGYAAYFGSTECGPAFEKKIIRGLFDSLGGLSWTRQGNWQDSDDVCSWEGVSCYEDGFRGGYIQRIDLSENNLKGALDNSIWELVHMKELDLSKNDVVVSFAGIANAQSLESLHISETKTSSLAGVDAAPSIRYLHATNCEIDGAIPGELYSMTQLKGLYLNYNELVGSISTSIGQLSQLEEFYLFHNALNGTIPTEIGLLNQVQIISLGENQLTGTLPYELAYLSELRILSLQRETKEPEVTHPLFSVVQDVGLTGDVIPFAYTPKLRELYLSDNHLGGDIPYDFLLGIDDTSATIRVDLSNNMISGPPPVSLVRFEDLRMDLSGNNLREIPDELCSKIEWFDGAMDAGCDALLCPPGTYNAYGRRIGSEGCETCTFRGSAGFYGSRTCGAIYPQGMSDSYMLESLYDATGGPTWKSNDNWLSTEVSVCDWHGITCGKYKGFDVVTGLDLSDNYLDGLVPSIIFYLPHLQVLDLGKNKIWVEFEDIEYSVLKNLYLHETNVASLKGISRAASLETLHLKQTKLTGQSIPEELYTLANLTVVDISGSGLTGTLSTSLGQLSRLGSLALEKNDLSGEIPSTIGLLTGLEIISLSDNNLWGSLPTEMSGLTALQSLFLDAFNRRSAGISGPLLPFSTMPRLRELNLGSNSLTGSIPSNLMAGIGSTEDVVSVFLGSNHLTGIVPAQLASFGNLNLVLSNNRITALGDGLCDKSAWLDGAVGDYSCSGLLCPAGTYNKDGRQVSADVPCIPCPGDSVPPFMGQTSCLTEEKKKERGILELFYKATGGQNWKTQSGWMSSDDYCTWYGISCTDNLTIQSISLGSNNLAGTPPEDLFSLRDLQTLWLYSNPISFEFKGIEKASNLQNLRVDSTGLKSLNGLEDATGLVDIDVRFNRVRGEMPSLDKLQELKTFSCSSNDLSGSLPSFKANKKLVAIRVGGNSFSGFLPSFSEHPAIRTGDFAANDFSGPIPDNLFALADESASVFLDLSSNDFTGSVPKSLSRFSDLTLYARDNRIESLPPSLCSIPGWNEGDVGFGGCDGILCPPSTYSPATGRSSRSGSKCEKCEDAQYFGSTTCGARSGAARMCVACSGVIVAVLSSLLVLLL